MDRLLPFVVLLPLAACSSGGGDMCVDSGDTAPGVQLVECLKDTAADTSGHDPVDTADTAVDDTDSGPIDTAPEETDTSKPDTDTDRPDTDPPDTDTGVVVDTVDTGEPTDTVDTSGPEDTVDTSPPPPEYDVDALTDGCSGATPEVIYMETAEHGWIGCNVGIGLWETNDGGTTWTSASEYNDGENFYVFDIDPDPLGGILVCGHEYYDSEKGLLMRYRDSVWSILLRYGSNTTDPTAAQLSNCGQVAALGDNTLVVVSNTAGDITVSEDDGATWTAEERYWEDENLDSGGYASYQMGKLVAANGSYWGAGSTITEPPMFFRPTEHSSGTWTNFHAYTIDSAETGEVRALATIDDGTTWFAGGRGDGSTASGYLYTSVDAGLTWTEIALGGDMDLVRDIRFGSDGLHGVAVGYNWPTSLGGFVLVTVDGGLTWEQASTDVIAPLESASVVTDETGNSYFVAGEAYFGVGTFPDEVE